jgi:hypothetical protein
MNKLKGALTARGGGRIDATVKTDSARTHRFRET